MRSPHPHRRERRDDIRRLVEPMSRHVEESGYLFAAIVGFMALAFVILLAIVEASR